MTNLNRLINLIQKAFSYVSALYGKIGARRSLVTAVIAVFLFISGITLAHMLWAIVTPLPAFGQLQNRETGESTKLYDRSGRVLLYDTKGSMRRVTVPLSEISPHLINAVIAIEDASFYEHDGVRLDAIARAFLSNVGQWSLNQGGSTITQQMVKNTFLTREKSVIRKAKEIILALRIERQYSKDQILETYLNETPYGGTIYGAEEASLEYFNTPAKELTLSEAAYLAALIKAPTFFSPWGPNRPLLKKRQALVLEKMFEHGMILKDAYDDALKEEIVFDERSDANIKAPHFVFYVLEELEKKYGTEMVYKGQLKVTTTLNWELQHESEQILLKEALKNEKTFNASNAALVAIDPKSGQVLAMIGSRDFFDESIDGQVNVARAERQPGSAFKPFAYATAFKKGYDPDTVLFDLKTQFSTACAPENLSNEYPCYAPENYDGQFKGPITLREALAQSINIVAVKTLYLGGIKNTIETARSLGITTLKDSARYGLTLVLGGGEVTLLEMTAAYGVFANDGIRHPTTPILAVENRQGKTLESYEGKPEQALDPEIARTINDILSDNNARAPAFGANSPLHFHDTVVADKTGTTNDYRDAWVIGYTPTIVVGAWAGNSDNTPMVKSVAAFILAPMWHTAMQKAIALFPSPPFNPPLGSLAKKDIPTLLASDTDPMGGVHEIQYWMNQFDPQIETSAPTYKDPQMSRWGYAVAVWASTQASSTIVFPWLALDTGGPDGAPLTMELTASSKNREVIVNQPFIVSMRHSEIKNILSVSYYLNDTYLGKSNTAPFSFGVVVDKEGSAFIRAVIESPLGESHALATVAVKAPVLASSSLE